ncbi:Ubiquitin homeostasis protein lub1 [Cyphellophora attinorum]|uniref:Ubiquitin homeostasis protein lub1 n=1 Tax=Cyphellophora attinorum TaxID=1664694 RepID=A0A0N1H4D0_9EURO|nr:Ubiquitin homeostasis protein lub1 [Phialophora attinorum]KPI40084.1 Ubiquitin homeostasis protein lub1 [Phialophora attinorum]
MGSPEYKLSAVLAGHTSDVRAVLFPDPSLAVTASRDGTTRIWKRTSTSPPTYDPSESSHGAQFKTCLAYVPGSKEYPEGLIISSGQDALIERASPRQGDWFVSGSWDSSARVWQIGRWETDVELQGHSATVWAVLAYDRDTVITGCADKGIRIFDGRGKQKHGFDGKDVVRALAALPQGHPSGAHFASASNDGCIRLWTLKGDLVAELWGHEAFIYSLAVSSDGEIISAGEDRTVRVWRGQECVQVITLPAISVWAVAVGTNGDIITGSSDKIARIFSRDPSRQADPSVLAEFEQSLQSSAVPKQAMNNDLNMQDMPGPDFLTQKSGTKEGQNQIIKEDDGSATLYQWSMSQQTWIKIGTVVDSAGSSDKKEYNGRQYDYVFDIDIEDGKPPLKLPYNVTQNPYEAATKFLQDNELPMTYLDETSNFIIKNSQGATIGQSSQAPVGADPWGSENRYRPGEVPQSNYQPRIQPSAVAKQVLPQKQYLPIALGKSSAALGQITKRNAEYAGSDLALSPAQLETLSMVAQQLDQRKSGDAPNLSSESVESVLPSLITAATKWTPASNRLAALDLLRFLAAALKTWPATDSEDVVAAILNSRIFEPSQIQANSKLIMIAARLFSNLLYGSGKHLIEKHLSAIIEALKAPSNLAQTDSGVAVAYATFALNASVYLTSSKLDDDVAATWAFELLEQLVPFLASVPTVDHTAGSDPNAQTTEPAYRALVALGTILVGLKHSAVKEAGSAMDVGRVLDQLQERKYLEEPRFQGVVKQLRGVL